MAKKKVLLVLNTINDYRVETYNHINRVFDLTVAYNVQDQTHKRCEFKKLLLHTRHIGPFNVFGLKFWRLCRNYDVVITSFDIHNFEFAIIPFVHRNYKLLTWSIGFRCSYTRPYDVNRRHTLLDKISYKILCAADANIFYMEKAKEFWRSTKLDLSKIFIAPNTTTISDISQLPGESDKTSILFVGSLYKEKGVDKLIRVFAEAIPGLDSAITLDIVGKGDQKPYLESLIAELGLSNRIFMHGPIYDESLLAQKYAKALVCVSPTQAGLTVPKSMGYGVPVITRRDAITGGELYHITSDENGILYDKDEDLVLILKQVIGNPEFAKTMGRKAKDYYQNNATPRHQAQGVIAAIEFALNSNR